ncbi:MAG: homoserine dehydrogenase, partial [Lachnospiraceae bacterium]|nr:homoserine dehydrogenase [Lachnospiraceae bacterium]
SKEDILYAKRMNMAIRLLATSRKAEDGRVFSMVSPFMVNSSSPLYNVNGVFNAVFIHGDMLGDSMYYGSGAGKLPTASAVVGDVVLCARNKGKTVMTFNSNEKLSLADIAEDSRRFLIRIPKEELDEAVINFGNCEIIRIEELSGEVGIVTGVLTEKEFEERSKKIGSIINRIRIK